LPPGVRVDSIPMLICTMSSPGCLPPPTGSSKTYSGSLGAIHSPAGVAQAA
jgi:hypothetical protein